MAPSSTPTIHPLKTISCQNPAMILETITSLAAINLWTILRFWQDKQRSIAGEWRIPEAQLLQLAMLGGSPGALLARHWFRHKTRKEPFSTGLQLISVIQAGLGIGYFVL